MASLSSGSFAIVSLVSRGFSSIQGISIAGSFGGALGCLRCEHRGSRVGGEGKSCILVSLWAVNEAVKQPREERGGSISPGSSPPIKEPRSRREVGAETTEAHGLLAGLIAGS